MDESNPTRSSTASRRTDEALDALASLIGVAFLVWLALGWTDETFSAGPAALLFSGFFLALAVACLLRCMSCVRRLSHGGRGAGIEPH